MNRRDVLRLTTGTAASLSVAYVGSALAGSAEAHSEKNRSGRKTIKTRLSKAFSVQHPLVCAGMAMVCDTADLGIAVASAGGIGAISGSLLSPLVLSQRIAEMRAATDGAFHINFLTLFPHEAQIQVCIENKVPIVSFHFGIPDNSVIRRLQSAGISVWIQIGAIDDARKAYESGADAILVQGNEAGGHTYAGMPLLALLPAVRDVVKDRLVVAAGGIADGRTAAAALAAGADGVMVGTRLVATDEANAHEDYKRRLIKASGEDTVITHVYGPEFPAFNPMRVIRNQTVTTWQNRIEELPKDRSTLKPIGRTLFAGQEKDVKPFDSIIPIRETTGDFEKMPMLAGQGVGLVNKIEPTHEIIGRLMNEAALIVEGFSDRTQAI